jgi:multiple sugar transport system ATP-binding protein
VAEVVLDEVTKVYADGIKAVDSLDLDIADGEFMVLVGPSGCGKTTALRMVAGLEEISGGVVRIGDRVVNHVPSRDRDIAMVFQSYALYPHLGLRQHRGLRVRRCRNGDRAACRGRRARARARPFLKRKPRARAASGSVAIGRAIVREP